MPLVRFKTGDISFAIEGHCGCGRNSVRLGPILGRKKQMMKVKGTTLYPQAVFTALEEIGGVRDYCLEVTSHAPSSDDLTIYLSLNDTSLARETVENTLQAKLRVTPRVLVEDDKALQARICDPTSRKPVRFFDRRRDAQLP